MRASSVITIFETCAKHYVEWCSRKENKIDFVLRYDNVRTYSASKTAVLVVEKRLRRRAAPLREFFLELFPELILEFFLELILELLPDFSPELILDPTNK